MDQVDPDVHRLFPMPTATARQVELQLGHCRRVGVHRFGLLQHELRDRASIATDIRRDPTNLSRRGLVQRIHVTAGHLQCDRQEGNIGAWTSFGEHGQRNNRYGIPCWLCAVPNGGFNITVSNDLYSFDDSMLSARSTISHFITSTRLSFSSISARFDWKMSIASESMSIPSTYLSISKRRIRHRISPGTQQQ